MSGKRRVLKDLKSARLLDEPPAFLATANTKLKRDSANWAGINYENKFAANMQAIFGDKVIHGPWIEYYDCRGRGVCQPDLVLLPTSSQPLVVFECKLSFTARKAANKMTNMYGPVTEYIWGTKPLLVQVCKFLKPSAKRTLIVKELDELWQYAIQSNVDAGIVTWNWRPL